MWGLEEVFSRISPRPELVMTACQTVSGGRLERGEERGDGKQCQKRHWRSNLHFGGGGMILFRSRGITEGLQKVRRRSSRIASSAENSKRLLAISWFVSWRGCVWLPPPPSPELSKLTTAAAAAFPQKRRRRKISRQVLGSDSCESRRKEEEQKFPLFCFLQWRDGKKNL